MRLRLARKIYFPKDVEPVRKERTLDAARRRLERRGYKWKRLSSKAATSEPGNRYLLILSSRRPPAKTKGTP